MFMLLRGIVLWLAGTIAIRLAGQWLLRPGLASLGLYAASFTVMALLVPRIARTHTAVLLIILPTLVLDSIACVFFPAVYPNLAPAAAGLFGGWMLACCGGAVAGAIARR